jgi:nitroimidazol reductase NimA-like FMN-containing flavoprotein (pyridoxamine 5'-phosphate oxidase superfamily)
MIVESKITQHPERNVIDQASEILANGMVAHIGFTESGRTYVIPTSYFYDASEPDRLYVHGGQTSRLMNVLATGVEVCVEITQLHGLVYSRTAKYHSMNYRSVVCFGRGRSIDSSDEKQRILKKAIERYFPGRQQGKDYEKAPQEHLAATSLVEIRIEEWSAKAREGGPKGPHDADPNAAGTCGVKLSEPS